MTKIEEVKDQSSEDACQDNRRQERRGEGRRGVVDRRMGLDRRRGPGRRRSEDRRAAEEGDMLPGTMDTLKRLKEQGFKVGIITRNCKTAVEIIFPHIEQYCDVFIPRDNLKQVKPHPDHLAMVLERLGVENSSDCLMVGDHILDIKAGKRMEMKTAGVLTGKTTRHQFDEAGADLIFDDATKVLNYLAERR